MKDLECLEQEHLCLKLILDECKEKLNVIEAQKQIQEREARKEIYHLKVLIRLLNTQLESVEDQARTSEESQKTEDVAEHKRLKKDFSDSNTGIESRFDPIERLSNEPW